MKDFYSTGPSAGSLCGFVLCNVFARALPRSSLAQFSLLGLLVSANCIL